MALCVCSVDSRDCMLLRCENCQGNMKNYLEGQFEDLDDLITYKYWKTNNRAELAVDTCGLSSYIDNVVNSVLKLMPHSFISKAQSQYLKSRKENLDKNSAIILMDFSENFTFKIQDEVQSYHWAHQSCTLHTVVCYYKDENNVLQTTSLCFITDDLSHDVCMVYHCQELTILHLKKIIPDLQAVEYFTDGCAGQYKNYKSLYNLCKHREEFGVTGTISFFATSHGKSPCDGIGGTVKRATAKASLQRTATDHILSSKDMYDYCKNNLKAIEFFLIEPSVLNSIRNNHEQRYRGLSTIKGTRSMHYFQPMSSTCIVAKRFSSDYEYSFVWDFLTSKPTAGPVKMTIGSFVAVVIDKDWFIGAISYIDAEQGDMSVSLLHPKGPSKIFHWPQHHDEQWVAEREVLCLIDPPAPVESGYQVGNSQLALISHSFSKFNLRQFAA